MTKTFAQRLNDAKNMLAGLAAHAEQIASGESPRSRSPMPMRYMIRSAGFKTSETP